MNNGQIVTLLINGNDFIEHAYRQCLQEQLEMFRYNITDTNHIYLTKHLIIVDTVLRMLTIYNNLITKVSKTLFENDQIDNIQSNANIRVLTTTTKLNTKTNKQHNVKSTNDIQTQQPMFNVILWYKEEHLNIRQFVLPMTTPITEHSERMIAVNKDIIYQQIYKQLTKVNYAVKSRDKTYYKCIETFLRKHGTNMTSSIELKPDSSLYVRSMSKRDYKHSQVIVDENISTWLSIFQMRLSISELMICIHYFLNILQNHTQHNIGNNILTTTIITTKNNISDQDFIKYGKNKFKHTNIVCLRSQQLNEHYVVDKDVKYCLYSWVNNHIALLPMNIYDEYNILVGYNFKFKTHNKSNYIIPNYNITMQKPTTITFQPTTFKQILEEMDKKYCNTLLYINTYIMAYIDNPEVLYVTKTFKTPYIETFEDTDLSFCSYEVLKDYISQLIQWFNRQFKCTIPFM